LVVQARLAAANGAAINEIVVDVLKRDSGHYRLLTMDVTAWSQ
jgi:hypothetical protein